jgi:hypothetical protein
VPDTAGRAGCAEGKLAGICFGVLVCVVLFCLEFGLSLVQNSQSCMCFVKDSDPEAHATKSLKTTTAGSFSSADIESLKRSNMILKVPSFSQPMPLKPLFSTLTIRQRLNLSATPRCSSALGQLWPKSARDAKLFWCSWPILKQRKRKCSKKSMVGLCLFFRVCFLFCTFASCSFATRPWGRYTPVSNCCAGLRSQVAGLEIYAKDLADKVSSLEMIKVECIIQSVILRSLPII